MSAYLRPSFFILGERKCGTSSLFRYLLEHPQVLPGERKEMQFFTSGPEEVAANFQSYLRRFPKVESDAPGRLAWPELDASGKLFEEEIEYPREIGTEYHTGEASADTFAEVSPALLKHYLPDLRLVLLLRDPVERAFSHHRMLKRFFDAGRELPHPVGEFASDMQAEMLAFESGAPAPLLSLGIYTPRLQAWHEQWGQEALLVLFTHDLEGSKTQPQLLERVRQHLGLDPWPSSASPRPHYNKAPTAVMSPAIRRELEAFYRPHNAKLASYLDTSLPWGQEP